MLVALQLYEYTNLPKKIITKEKKLANYVQVSLQQCKYQMILNVDFLRIKLPQLSLMNLMPASFLYCFVHLLTLMLNSVHKIFLI